MGYAGPLQVFGRHKGHLAVWLVGMPLRSITIDLHLCLNIERYKPSSTSYWDIFHTHSCIQCFVLVEGTNRVFNLFQAKL